MNTTDQPYRFFRGVPFSVEGWAGTDPERVVLEFVSDQRLAVSRLTGCDLRDAWMFWSGKIVKRPIRLRDESCPDRVLVITSTLPDRLARLCPAEATLFAVCLRKINSGRPFVAEWMVPISRKGTLGLFGGGVELYPPEFAALNIAGASE